MEDGLLDGVDQRPLYLRNCDSKLSLGLWIETASTRQSKEAERHQTVVKGDRPLKNVSLKMSVRMTVQTNVLKVSQQVFSLFLTSFILKKNGLSGMLLFVEREGSPFYHSLRTRNEASCVVWKRRSRKKKKRAALGFSRRVASTKQATSRRW